MNQKVKSISEAFSMQPITISIMETDEAYYDKPRACKEIKLEYLESIFDNSFTEYYVGYNFEGERIFKYLSNSVNVHYQI